LRWCQAAHQELPESQFAMSVSKAKTAPKLPEGRRPRRHPRYRGEFRIVVTHLLASHYQKIDGHCRDLSQGGIGILLAAELQVGDVVNLTFSLPGSSVSWDVNAVTRFRRGYQYGFEFLSLTKKYQDLLNIFLKTRQPMD
jgi:hypothetical protein